MEMEEDMEDKEEEESEEGPRPTRDEWLSYANDMIRHDDSMTMPAIWAWYRHDFNGTDHQQQQLSTTTTSSSS